MNPHPDSQQAVLSEQALNLLELHSQPFSERPAGHDYFSDPVMQMQLNMLQHNIKFSDMLQVLKGDAGCGKTALIIQMLANASDEFQIFVARGTSSLTAIQIISGMLKIFQQPVPTEIDRCLESLIEHLKIRLNKNLSSVLIVENAHTISTTALNQLLEYTDGINDYLDGELRILLVAEPEIEAILPDLTSKQLREGKIFISNVRTLDRKRTNEYVTHRLQKAGLTGSLPFSGKQLTDLYTNSDGIPQKIDAVAASMLNQQANQQPLASRVQQLPLHIIGGAAAAAVLLSLLLFIFTGSDSAETDAAKTDTENKTHVELNPTVISATDESPPATEEPLIKNALSAEPKAESPTADHDAQITEEPGDADATALTLLGETNNPTNDEFAQSHGITEPIPVEEAPKPQPTPEPEKQQPDKSITAASTQKTVETKTTKPRAQASPQARPFSESEQWLLKQKPGRYIIQLLASYDETELSRYAKTNKIESKTALFETVRNGRQWHVMTYGLYASAEAARAAISRLPDKLQRRTPWIRSVRSVQAAIKKQR